MFDIAICKAPSLMSSASISRSLSRAIDKAIAPEPVPISIPLPGGNMGKLAKTRDTNSSVSGLGISTFSSTFSR